MFGLPLIIRSSTMTRRTIAIVLGHPVALPYLVFDLGHVSLSLCLLSVHHGTHNKNLTT
jgi:hypothetical protein